MTINARNKGSAYERKLAKEFRELGYTECRTSREVSKIRDNMGVDLCGVPDFNVQAKAVENLGSVHMILKSMPEEVGVTNVVFHKRNRKGEVVSMKKEDFYKLITKE